MSYRHMIDKRCIQANDKIVALLKPDFTVANRFVRDIIKIIVLCIV